MPQPGCCLPHGAPVAVRRRDAPGGEQDRAERGPERLHPAHAHAPRGVPVVPALEAHEAGLFRQPRVAPVLERHLERHLDRRGAVVREEDPGQPLRGDGDEPLGQPLRGLVGDAREQDVVEPLHLPRDGFPDPRVAVAVDDAPPARDGVVIPVPVPVEQEQPLRAVDPQRRVGRVGAHLRVRMPAAHQRASTGRGTPAPPGRTPPRPRRDWPGTAPPTAPAPPRSPPRCGRCRTTDPPEPSGPPPGTRLKISPARGIPRRRIDSTVSSAWLTHPRRLPTTTRTGIPRRATTSQTRVSFVSGTRNPPTPSTRTMSWDASSRRYAASIRDGSMTTPSRSAARCGDAG